MAKIKYWNGSEMEELASAETTQTIGDLINSATSKTPPIDADYLPLMDSVAGNILTKLSWANLKSAIATYIASLTTTWTNKTLTSPKINENVAVTATATELNYVDGVTSAIQTQFGAKAPVESPVFTTQATAPTNATYTTAQIRNVIESTADPSGGNNGDIWLKYTP